MVSSSRPPLAPVPAAREPGAGPGAPTSQDDDALPPPARDAEGPGRDGGATITVCPDGPLLVRGDVDIVGTDGEPVERRRSTVALCRCGRSSLAPYCDGSHKVRKGPRRG
ncbi:CDGSH iron-sulfur domain-containing protein [Pseudokineococcus sp. 5B2Z-1]|uniref:CDGSH iron-sulfur domain-containing protein n=1 Tax=Pseudokineococcus sp. 5B2Z-1 TaxID=3132744 RepID=UPI003098122B